MGNAFMYLAYGLLFGLILALPIFATGVLIYLVVQAL